MFNQNLYIMNRILLFKECGVVDHDTFSMHFYMDEKCKVSVDVVDYNDAVRAENVPLLDSFDRMTSVPKSVMYEMLKDAKNYRRSDKFKRYAGICMARVPMSLKAIKFI